MDLPTFNQNKLQPTRDYLQDLTKVVGKLQQVFLPEEEHGWHYGLEVTMRGICTQSFKVNQKDERVLIDLVKHKLRLGNQNWQLGQVTPFEILNEVRQWLKSIDSDVELTEPKLSGETSYDSTQASNYANAVWWLEKQFSHLKTKMDSSKVSPILLYPHHFDLALTHFMNNKEQRTFGFSTGDENLDHPYLYLTGPVGVASQLPPGVRRHSVGFDGLVMDYDFLIKNPELHFSNFSQLF